MSVTLSVTQSTNPQFQFGRWFVTTSTGGALHDEGFITKAEALAELRDAKAERAITVTMPRS